MSFAPLPFWTAISDKKNDFNFLDRLTESYFNFGSKKAKVVNFGQPEIEVRVKLKKYSYFFTSLKIIAVATILLPLTLIFLPIKWIFRTKNHFVYLKEKPPSIEDSLSSLWKKIENSPKEKND